MAQVATDGTVTRTFGHDGADNIVADTQGGSAWTFAHNAAGHLSQASVNGTLKGAYTYDGRERLAIRAVTNTTPSGTTHLIYDTAGHLLAEAMTDMPASCPNGRPSGGGSYAPATGARHSPAPRRAPGTRRSP
jgi:YD repeat-containing protein